MKILFITFIDIINSLPQRSHHLIDYLKERYDLTVVFCRYDDLGVMKKQEGTTKYIGIPVKFASLFSPMTLYKRYLEIDSEKYDICIAQGPWAGVTAVELLKAGRVNFLAYEDIDYFPAFFEYEDIYNRTRNMEKYCIESSDITFSVNEQLIELRKNMTGITPYYIPNGVNYELFKGDKVKHNGTILVFSGSLEHWAGIEMPIKALPILRRELDVSMMILGRGKYEPVLKKLSRDYKVNDFVHFLGKVKYRDLPLHFKKSDIGLCTLFPTELIKYSFPLKAIEYMAAGLPVIATDIGDLGKLIKENECGITIKYSVIDFVEKTIDLIENRDKMSIYGQNGRNFAKLFDWKELFKKEMNIIFEKLDKRIKYN
ncbi:glycosyltransferase [Thermoanaerobacterium thermosaccharolyticum]|uniref:glycosyltransferase n=1 Tax=Thermoanaerobacterium thermosaccharolyticum TaxID=1517 RepID=UPI0012386541|nr:glycosyltransferase [Thermoanaerobacterium thermosaccharolyticum]KAA5807282.1 glycosyltransferase family 4 protein [Thermoanaerobacterium thermosaccharolyticum]